MNGRVVIGSAIFFVIGSISMDTMNELNDYGDISVLNGIHEIPLQVDIVDGVPSIVGGEEASIFLLTDQEAAADWLCAHRHASDNKRMHRTG